MQTNLLAPGPATTAEPVAPSPETRYWAFALVGSVMCAAMGHLLIKYGLNAAASTTAAALPLGARLMHFAMNPALLLGLLVYGTGTAMWIFAVARREISYLYPLTALNYLVIALGGKVLFGELVSPGRWAGISVVVVGVILMQWSAREDQR